MTLEVRYVVLDDNTLGYIYAAQPYIMGILGANIHGHNWRDGIVAVWPGIDRLRDATVADFHRFRVSSNGYFKD